MTAHRPRPIAACALLLLFAVACGDDDFAPYEYLGHACRDDFDCAPGVDCETGGDFPEGTGTLPCRGHFDGPRGTACVDVRGGLCLVYCSNELHCRDRYDCKERDDRDNGGESQVCIH